MPVSDKELLLNDLIQPHWDSFTRDTLVLIKRESLRPPKVFISYAWPSQRYPGYDGEKDIQAWLVGLDGRLTALGINVLFDIKTMTLGTNIDEFMKQSVENCNAILMIGTQTYKTRSEENDASGRPTNVKCEVEHIQEKIKQKGSGCVVPILYRGEFHNALPNLGQILGTDCHDEFLYQKNLPVLIEGLFQLQTNADYQKLKIDYLTQLQSIGDHGLSSAAVSDFAQNRAQKVRAALAMQQEAVNLMLEHNAKGHPDYVPRPAGSESPAVKMLANLKEKYSRFTHVQALFGEPLALEGQYINVQMLYQVIEEREQEADNNNNSGKEKDQGKAQDVDKNKESKDARIPSSESIFSKKEPLAIHQLFTPAKTLLTDKQKTYEARPDLPPSFVLLQGRAGSGKTTFVNFVTREWALGRLWQEYHWVFSLRCRDLRSGAFQQANDKKETWRLEDWLYEVHFAAHMDKPSFQLLWTWLIEPDLKTKKVLFILDGYDETPHHHPCEQTLIDLLHNDTFKIVTSRPYGLSDLPKDRRELEIIGFTDENVDKYVNLYFKQNQDKAKFIITGLRAAPTLWGSAHIPVTLNVICGILETENDIPTALAKLHTMSGLYETMEVSLLERAYLSVPGKEKERIEELTLLDKKGKIELLTTHYKALRQCLSKLAFEAFSKQQLTLTPENVNSTLEELGIPVTERATKIKALLELGLLKKVLDENTHTDTNYEFLHLTFQEYYAGHHLLWRVEQNSPTILEDFAKIKLDPRYQLVVWFVAGTIKDAQKFDMFMRALAAPQGGDMLGNVQLGLMVRCTAENWILAQQTSWVKAITKMLQKRIQGLRERFKRGEIDESIAPPVWVQMVKISSNSYQAQTGELDLFPDALVKAKSFFHQKRETSARFIGWLALPSPTMLNTLAELLIDCDYSDVKDVSRNTIANLSGTEHREEYVRQAALEAIGNLGAAAATPEFLARLAQLLAKRGWWWADTRRAAITAIGKLDVAAATPEFLGQLVKLMEDKDMRLYTIRAISQLGTAAATRDILVLLAKSLADEDRYVREAAAEAVGKLGAAAATPDILMLLAECVADIDENASRAAIKAIGDLGAAAATSNILTVLVKTAESKHHGPTAIAAIGKLAVAGTLDILALLTLMMADKEEYVRHAATHAIGNLGAVAATKDILTLLPNLLADKDCYVRKAATAAVGKLGIVAATPNILGLLSRGLMDRWPDRAHITTVSQDTLEAIGQLGAAAATPEFLALLTNLMADANSNVYGVAFTAISKLGTAAATKDILALLAQWMMDKEWCRRCMAAGVVGHLGAAAATPTFLTLLAKLMADEHTSVCLAAVDAIGQLGAAAAIPDILALFTKLMDNDRGDRYARTTVIKAIGNLGAAAATKEILALLAKLLADKDEYVRYTVVVTISQLSAAAATNEILIALTRSLVSKHYDTATYALPKLVSAYLCKNITIGLPETHQFPALATTLISGAYLSGNTSCNLAYDTVTSAYHLRGFADKTPFNISITHAQAQWFIYWSPQIIQSLDEDTLSSKLAEIEKVGMNISAQKSLAWFDQSSSSSSSSSASSTSFYHAALDPKKAYGLSNDAVVTAAEPQQKQETEKQCLVM